MRDTIDMACEAFSIVKGESWNSGFWTVAHEELQAFEALVRADERSACCDAIWKCDGMGLEDRFIAMDVIKARGAT